MELVHSVGMAPLTQLERLTPTGSNEKETEHEISCAHKLW